MTLPDKCYKALLHSLPDASLCIDQQGRVLEWSPRAAEVFGWSEIDVIGATASDLHLPEAYGHPQVPGIPVFIRAIGRKSTGPRDQYLAINALGEEFAVNLTIVAADDAAPPQSYLLMIHDISSRKIIEERMAQTAKMDAIGHLVSGLAHDFNNILGIVVGSLEALRGKLKDPQNLELVGLACQASDRGRDVTRAMQAVARREAIKPERTNINEAILKLQPLLQRASAKPIELMLIAEAANADAIVDLGALNNVLINFVVNAADAIDSGGMVVIYTQNVVINADDPIELVDLEPGHYLVIGVDDNGSGMPPDVLSRAIEPFFTTKAKGKGTGLGLAIAYAFAKQSRGALRIRSTPGKGTNIHLFLPLIRSNQTAS